MTTDSAGPPWTGWKVEVGATGGSAGTEWSIFISTRDGKLLSGSGGVGGDGDLGDGDGGTGGEGRMNH